MVRTIKPRHPALSDPQATGLLGSHRGAPGRALESTHEAFELALALGADFLECDVRWTRDGVPVIHHGPRLGGRLIRLYTYEELIDYAPSLLTLEQLVELAAGRTKLDIELKEAGNEQRALSIVRHQFTLEDFVVTSFRDEVITYVKSIDPRICTGLLVGDYIWKYWWLRRPSDMAPLRRWRRCGADFIVCSRQLADWGLIRRLSHTDVPLMVWVAGDDPTPIDHYRHQAGVVAVISNLAAG